YHYPPRGDHDAVLTRAALHPLGLARAIEPVEHNPEAIERFGVAGLELDGALVRAPRTVQVVQVIERFAQVIPRGRACRVHLRRLTKPRHGLGPQSLP